MMKLRTVLKCIMTNNFYITTTQNCFQVFTAKTEIPFFKLVIYSAKLLKSRNNKHSTGELLGLRGMFYSVSPRF